MAEIALGQSYSANGAQQEADQRPPDAIAQEKTLVKYLKALRDSSKANTMKYMKRFSEAWLYAIGESRFPAPQNQAAKQQEKHLSRCVRNSMYAMMDHKVSFLTDATPKVATLPLQPIPDALRIRYESILDAELERLEWRKDGLQVAWDAEVGGVGFTLFYARPDKLTGETIICTREADPSRTYVNKQATSLRDALYVCHECEMSLAEIREYWPDQGYRVKPRSAKPLGMGEDAENYKGKTDDELVQLPGNEFIVGTQGQIVEQEATVTWAWEKNDEVRTLWEESQNESLTEGYACLSCGALFSDSADTQDMGCPDCESPDVVPFNIPPGSTMKRKISKREYPYGRCIVGVPEQGVILFEGPNELPLERVFPLAMFRCYVKSRSFYGFGDYHLLKSNSKAQDQNVGLLKDHLTYNAHPILEHPNTAEAYNTIGNAPGTRAPVDESLSGMARFLAGGAFDYNGFTALDRTLQQDAAMITSVDEILRGGGPGPESGEAIKARAQARGKRIAGTLERYNEYLTDYAAIVWELMTKLYTSPRSFTVKGPSNEITAITEIMAQIPTDFVVQVTADPDRVETDRLMGQNMAQFVQSGAIFDPKIRPFVDVVMRAMGVDANEAQQIQQKLNESITAQEQQPPPPPPPPDPAAILVAMSDILKVQPTFVSFDQVQQALSMAGIAPAQEGPQLVNHVLGPPPKMGPGPGAAGLSAPQPGQSPGTPAPNSDFGG